ncbi:MAG: CIC family chloride channel protein, partial [Candidatus Azotimanducaceae bacterium]
MPQFAILGAVSGLVTGLVIVAFRALIELPLTSVMGDDPENFEALDTAVAFLLPVGGGLVLAALFAFISPANRRVGVVH